MTETTESTRREAAEPTASPSRRDVFTGLATAAALLPAAAPLAAAAATGPAGAVAAEGAVAAAPASAPGAPLAEVFGPALTEAMDALQLAARRLHDVTEDALEREGITDLRGSEALLLGRVGEAGIGAWALRRYAWSDGRGYHRQIRGLQRRGYIDLGKAEGRTVIVLTDKGRDVVQRIAEAFRRNETNARHLTGVSADDLAAATRTLARLDRFWTDTILYRL